MSSRERDADETTRDDQADSPRSPGRTRTIARSRRTVDVVEHDDSPPAGVVDGDELPTELVPAIDPLLPPVRKSSNGDGSDASVTDAADPGVADPDVADPGIAEEIATDVIDEASAPTVAPNPAPAPAPSLPAPTVAVPAGVDTSNPIPVITSRATVVGAERHLVAPVHRAVGRRPRVRKVTRVVRHVDPWTVFKVAAVFSVVIYGVLLTAGVLLWNVAYTTGTVDNMERFFESFGWETFEFNGGQIYHAAWIAGLFGAVALTGFAVLGATLFNLITDLVGGVRFTVLEEEVVEKTASPMRRFTVRRTESDPTPPG